MGAIGVGAATVVEAKLSGWESFPALGLYCVLASSSYLIAGSLIVGLWLVADSTYLLVS